LPPAPATSLPDPGLGTPKEQQLARISTALPAFPGLFPPHENEKEEKNGGTNEYFYFYFLCYFM
jgi:hypothetical protein